MKEIIYKDGVVLRFEHVPIHASANPITGMRYYTKVYLVSGTTTYPIGEFDAKLDEEEIRARFEESMKTNQERQYGQQRAFLRKELPQRRSYLNRGITKSISAIREI